jgi:hypothetical protein
VIHLNFLKKINKPPRIANMGMEQKKYLNNIAR